MMEPLKSPDGSRNTPERCPRPLDSRDYTQEHQEIPQGEDAIKVELKEEDENMCLRTEELCKEEEMPPEISTDGSSYRNTLERSPHPPYSQNYTQEYQVIPQEHHEINLVNHKISVVNQEIPQQNQVESHSIWKTEVKEEAEEPSINGNEPCKEEQIAAEVSTDKRLENPGVSPDEKIEGNEVTSDSLDECPKTPDPSPCKSGPSRHGKSLTTPTCTKVSRHVTQRKKGEFQCYECSKSFPKLEQLLSHQRKHTAKQHTCSECGKSFARKPSLIRHQKTHTGEEPYSCSECDKCFILKANLLSHMRTHANSGDTRNSQREVQTKKVAKGQMQNNNKETPPQISTEKHSVTSPIQGAKDGDVTTSSSKENSITPNLPPAAPHVDPSPAIPANRGVIPDKLHTVTQKTAPSAETLMCYQCGKCFINIKELLTHQRTHTMKKTYDCTECGKSFQFRTALVLHLRSHTGEKPFACPECGKCFSHKSSVTIHLRIHTGEKPHVCPVCGKGYAETRLLRMHERIHTGEKPFACAECGRRFIRRSVLVAHMRCHTGEMPYSCSECGKQFAQRSSQVAHKRIHTGEQPYSCLVCGRAFSLKRNRDFHQKTQHTKKV